MRRFACHRLYLSPAERLSPGVVELEDGGGVCGWFALEEETSATRWIGGVIVLSPAPCLEVLPGEAFRGFLERAACTSPGGRMYAWRITGLALPHEEFGPQARCVRL